MLKRILLAPALWLEKYAIRDGQFTGRAKRTAKVVTEVSIVTLVADPLLSMARFGEFGLSHPLYYVVMAALILMIYLIMRPGAETSLREMRRSQNWFVKGIFFSLFGALLAIDWLVNRWPETCDTNSLPSSKDADHYPIGSDGQNLDEDTRQNLYMDDMANPPGW
ncbi:hypothetical protein [Marinobacterium weihaiense]|uniref:Uncharacterized protein n=1 Tax=Marinobacterium weihaiense TaxID=2851016 RepID=A0ABS6MEM6_9GAMM|nr:hypothetical protein [Marinobacterium weihaiense]MBV0934187.1 hypothetical protein [Marinobacterium weihaiense]